MYICSLHTSYMSKYMYICTYICSSSIYFFHLKREYTCIHVLCIQHTYIHVFSLLKKICMYTCMNYASEYTTHVRIYIHIYVFMHMCIHVYSFMYICIYIFSSSIYSFHLEENVYVYMFSAYIIHIYIHSYMYIYTLFKYIFFSSTSKYTCIYVLYRHHTCLHTYSLLKRIPMYPWHTHTHTHTHSLSHTHTHTFSSSIHHTAYACVEKDTCVWGYCVYCTVYCIFQCHSFAYIIQPICVYCTAYCICSVIHSHTSYSLFVCIVQPIAFGVSFNLNRHQPIRQYTHTHASFSTHAYCVYCTVYCIWSVIQSQSPIVISSVSFQRNVAKET